MKGIACILIVFIHCQFPGYIGTAIRVSSRFAVPFFFMISGYFCIYGNPPHWRKDKGGVKIIHISKIIIFAILFYALFHSFLYCMIGESCIYEEFLKNVSVRKLKIFLIHNSPFVYSHIWFLFALMYLYILCTMLQNKILGIWKLPIVILCSLLFALLGEILPSFGYSKEVLPCFIPTNTFVLRAMPFFFMGMLMREYNTKLSTFLSMPNRLIITSICIGCLMSMIERLLFCDTQFYIGSYISVFFIFIFCLKNPSLTIKSLEYCGRNLSMIVYIVHVAYIILFRYLISHQIINETIWFLWFRPLFVLVLSIATAYLMRKLPILKDI